jgi:uncharacterized protein YdcH (DUF465 family)
MEMNREKIIHHLIETDKQFEKWMSEHRRLDVEAQELDEKEVLIPSDEFKIRELKKQKLRLKDFIEKRIQENLVK